MNIVIVNLPFLFSWSVKTILYGIEFFIKRDLTNDIITKNIYIFKNYESKKNFSKCPKISVLVNFSESKVTFEHINNYYI